MGGPIWAEPLHDFAWVEAARAALDRDKACYAQVRTSIDCIKHQISCIGYVITAWMEAARAELDSAVGCRSQAASNFLAARLIFEPALFGKLLHSTQALARMAPCNIEVHRRSCVSALSRNPAQYERLKGLLTTVAEELPDAPLYFNHHDICKTLKCTPFKSELLRSAILNAGGYCLLFALPSYECQLVCPLLRDSLSNGMNCLSCCRRMQHSCPYRPPPAVCRASSLTQHSKCLPCRLSCVRISRQPVGGQDRRTVQHYLGHHALLGAAASGAPAGELCVRQAPPRKGKRTVVVDWAAAHYLIVQHLEARCSCKYCSSLQCASCPKGE